MAHPARQRCLELAATLGAQRPGLTVLEVCNEVRVQVRADRSLPPGTAAPGVDAIRHWMLEAVAQGVIPEPEGLERRERSQRQRRKT
jgi:hypothetical protein